MNQLKTILLLGALSALLVTIGGLIGGGALYVFLAIAVLMNVGSYFYSDKIVLRMSRARLIEREQAPALFSMVEELAHAAGLPMPRVAVVPDPTPNAFATGRNPANAVVAVTEGLMRITSPRELRGVIAHELAHVKHRDTLVATIAAAVATAITFIANIVQWSAVFGGVARDDDGDGGFGALLMALLAPIGATMIQMGISRSREFMADEFAARLTRDPDGLADALSRLQSHGRELLRRGARPMEPVTTSLAIVNPLAGLRGRGAGLANLFSTHPPIEERIRRLRAMQV
ncbi:MAG TPA: protease HtpX [bacterium]|nr:protease HtpX [bacterium]